MPIKNKTLNVGNVGPNRPRKNVRRPSKKLTWHLIVSKFMSSIKWFDLSQQGASLFLANLKFWKFPLGKVKYKVLHVVNNML